MPDSEDRSSGPPAHVAIIMDGNGRWARARGLPRSVGHARGAEAVRRAVRGASELGIRYLTLFGFSSENWQRPAGEISDLMGLLRRYLRSEIAELHRKNVRFRVIGERAQLDPDIVALIESGEAQTANNDGLTLVVALSYGARQELVNAARALAAAVRDGHMDAGDIDAEALAGRLYTADMPDPDLIIRTSGEQRLSNFLLWQAAYAEFVFIDKHWPDFGKDDLAEAIQVFQGRHRRYGVFIG